MGLLAKRLADATLEAMLLGIGQVRPGVPVWRLGAESRFPIMPYIVFPGNVGEAETLAEVVTELIGTQP